MIVTEPRIELTILYYKNGNMATCGTIEQVSTWLTKKCIKWLMKNEMQPSFEALEKFHTTYFRKLEKFYPLILN